MKRSSKPIPHRNKARRPAEASSQQRADCLERDGYRCAFEVSWERPLRARNETFTASVTEWDRCTVTGEQHLQACHVIRKRTAGHAAAHVDVVIAGCVPHHRIADHSTHPSTWDTVRFPEAAIARAVAAVKRHEADRKANCKGVVPLKGFPDE